jgi:hypothetical protein
MNHQPAADDPRVVESLRSSVLLAAAAALMETMWRAFEASRAGAAITAAKQQWAAERPAQRRGAVGIMLVAAALTALALTAATDHPAGWLWIAPAAMAASFGAVLIVSARTRT